MKKSYNSLPQEKIKSPYDPIGDPSGGLSSSGYWMSISPDKNFSILSDR